MLVTLKAHTNLEGKNPMQKPILERPGRAIPFGKAGVIASFLIGVGLAAASNAYASGANTCVDIVGTNDCPYNSATRVLVWETYGPGGRSLNSPETISVFQPITITQNANAGGSQGSGQNFYFKIQWDNGPLQSMPLF